MTRFADDCEFYTVGGTEFYRTKIDGKIVVKQALRKYRPLQNA